MPRSGRFAVAGACALLVSTGCTDTVRPAAAEPPVRPDGIPDRRFVDVSWEPVFTIGGAVDDTSLAMPARPAATGHGVYIVDGYLKRLQYFGLDGTRRWSFGGEGGGPGEFRLPRDLKIDGEGNAWVLDPTNARITVVSEDGEAVREIGLDALDRPPDRIVPLPDGQAILLDHRPDSPFVRIDARGRILSRGALPLRGLTQLGSLGAQLVPRGDAISGRWSAAFMTGDGFFTFDGDRLRHPHAWFVEPSPWPEIITEQSGNVTRTRMRTPASSANSIVLDGDRVLIHFDGRSDQRLRVIDVYSAADGSYIESFTLPRRYGEIDFREGILFGVYADPFPGLDAWRLVRN